MTTCTFCERNAISGMASAVRLCRPHLLRLRKYGSPLNGPAIRKRQAHWQTPGRRPKGANEISREKPVGLTSLVSVARTIALGACPRCGGAAEQQYEYWSCVQCGHEWSVKV